MSPSTAAPASQPQLLLDKATRAAAKKARKEARRAQRRATAAASAALSQQLGTTVNLAGASSVAGKPLPPIPGNLRPNAVTICLMYQYREPAWNKKEHAKALHEITQLATRHKITGRGRCAPEGVNCTLTGNAQEMRDFCMALRTWDPQMFTQTDFKLTDNQDASARFRYFTLRNVQELVAYGLEGIKAPSLKHHAGKHLEAHDYHAQMQDKDSVIIDVRNAYESDIGHFSPPPGGATLLKPKMRNSLDFPKWLNAPDTRQQLQGKTVMMYCTGGIRCERATALLNQMTETEQQQTADDDDKDDTKPTFYTKDVVMVRGGIERYLKTFPTGGFWKGSNYLFDQRREQVPEQQQPSTNDKEIESHCCVCHTPYALYRGQHRCAQILSDTNLPCNVPVIVCPDCQDQARQNASTLTCPLCAQGYQIPTATPDLVGQKRKLGVISQDGKDYVTGQQVEPTTTKRQRQQHAPSRRLFCGKLPLRITASALRTALQRAAQQPDLNVTIRWIVDHDTQAFYGSAFCDFETVEMVQTILERTKGTLPVGQYLRSRKKHQMIRPARIAYGREDHGQVSSSSSSRHYQDEETEYPPLGKVL